MNGDMFQFTSGPKPKAPEMPGGDMMNQVRDMSRRLRIIEERYSSLRKNIQVNEQGMLAEGKRFASEFKTINMEISEIKSIMLEMKEEMRMIIADVRESVKKEELKVLEKYVNLWEPLNFVTPAEVEKIVQRQLDKLKTKDSP